MPKVHAAAAWQFTVTLPVVKLVSQPPPAGIGPSVSDIVTVNVPGTGGHVKIVWFSLPASLLFGSFVPVALLSDPPVVDQWNASIPGSGAVAPPMSTSDWPTPMFDGTAVAPGRIAVLPTVPLSFTLAPASSVTSTGFATIVFQTGQLVAIPLMASDPESRPWFTVHCMATATLVVVRLTTVMGPTLELHRIVPSSLLAVRVSVYPLPAATEVIVKLRVFVAVMLRTPAYEFVALVSL